MRFVEAERGRPLAVCADLCGPKIRVGMIENGAVELRKDDEIVIQRQPLEGNGQRISTTLPELVDVVSPGEHILLSDGRLRLQVLRRSPEVEFRCRVLVGGTLASGKGVNVPDTDVPISALTEKDMQDIRWISARDFDYVALSFVQRAST